MHKAHLLSLDTFDPAIGALDQWDTRNYTNVGNIITVEDYKGLHDLANPALANKPLVTLNDPNFNGETSFKFDGIDDYFYKAVSNWRFGDVSGISTGVFSSSAVAYGHIEWLDSSDVTSGYRQSTYNRANKPAFLLYDLEDGQRFGQANAAPNINDGTVNVVSFIYTGTTFKFCVNKTMYAVTMSSGINDGKGIGYIQNRDNITIGAKVAGSSSYGKLTWAYGCYRTYTTDAAIISLHDGLMARYGL